MACFAPEAPWRDWLTTKVIKSSQFQFILLTFKNYEESNIEFLDITCICSLCLFNLKNVGPILYNTHTLGQSSELNAGTLLSNLVFSQANVFMIWVSTEKGFGKFWFLWPFIHFPFLFFSKLSLTSGKKKTPELHPLEKNVHFCFFHGQTSQDWILTLVFPPSLQITHSFLFLQQQSAKAWNNSNQNALNFGWFFTVILGEKPINKKYCGQKSGQHYHKYNSCTERVLSKYLLTFNLVRITNIFMAVIYLHTNNPIFSSLHYKNNLFLSQPSAIKNFY